MRLLIIHNKYKSKYIGGEDVVFGRELKALKRELGSENVFEYSVSNDNINKISIIFSIWFSRKHYKNIYKIVRKNKIDLVHVHNFYPLLTSSIFKASKKAGAKTVQTLHNFRWWCLSGIFYRKKYGICEICSKKKLQYPGIIYKCYRGSFFQSLLTALAIFFYKTKRAFKYIDIFFVLTEFQKNKVLEMGVNLDKIVLKPNFIKIDIVENKEKKDFIYVGKLDESKGVLKLLETWKKLDNKYVLRLIGEGDLSNSRDNFTQDNIVFLGKLNNKETLNYISNSKYLIFPSMWYETFGLTIIEAMSLGVPVVGFDIGPRREFIKNEFNGFLIKPEKLKETIERIYDFENYENLSFNARNFAQNYSENTVLKNQINIYKKIIDGDL